MYCFTQYQLVHILNETIDMFLEYQNVHGQNIEEIRGSVSYEIIEGLDAEQELWELGEVITPTQLFDVQKSV